MKPEAANRHTNYQSKLKFGPQGHIESLNMPNNVVPADSTPGMDPETT